MLHEFIQALHPPSAILALISCLFYLHVWYAKQTQFLKIRKTIFVWQKLQEKLLAYKYLINGTSIIEDMYKKSNGQPFQIQTPEKLNIMVTSQKYIQELDKAPRHQLSLHAVAKEFLQPRQTMHGFEWKDQRGVEGTGFVRAIRNLLTAQLPALVPRLAEVVRDQMAEEVADGPKTKCGFTRVPLFKAAKHMVTLTNCAVFFPAELSSQPEFVKAALEFPEDVFLAAEILRILPRGIAPFLARLATRNHKSTTTMYNHLYPVVQNRMELSQLAVEERGEEPNDGVQWLINTTPKRGAWSTERLVGEIMAIWYGSLHTLAISSTYAIFDLYSRPEYIDSLREELSKTAAHDEFHTTSEGFPVMDSFLRESARLSAFESTGIRRQALEDYRFSDGLRVPKGSWVCVPHRAMMRDEQYYQHAEHFDGRRFLSKKASKQEEEDARLSTRTDSWMVWGAGRITCPGRFYAVAVLKLILCETLSNYDCELEAVFGSRSAQWRSALIPRAGLTLRMRKRSKHTVVE